MKTRGTVSIRVENLSKQYRLGEIGTGTLSKDLNRWWAKLRGKEDPYLKIGEINDRSTRGKSEFVWALRELNFEVGQGEVLGIIGKNGAGKSTLLKILSRVTGPTTGSVKVRGRIASLLEVGTGFHPELTGRENIFLNGTILGMTRKEVAQKMDDIVQFAGVARYLDTPVKRYSSGMKVRLGFAVAAHLDPDILVVDEVLAVGDAEFQQKAIGKIKQVCREGDRTVLFVSHNMASVRALCDRAILIDNGQITFDGAVPEAISSYLGTVKNSSFNKLSAPEFFVEQFSVNEIRLSVSGTDSHGKWISGEPGEIVLGYSTSIREPLELTIRIIIESDELGVVAVLNNYHSGNPLVNPPGSGYIVCGIEQIPFRKGEFTLSFLILNHRTKVYENQHALTFQVLEGDFFNTGKLPRIQSLMHLRHHWSMGSNNDISPA